MTRVFFWVWTASLTLAFVAILALLAVYHTVGPRHSHLSELEMDVDIVFIGSSLAAHALPVGDLPRGVIEDGRTHEVFSAPGITEELSNKLLARAVDSGAQTIFVEINAYAHEMIPTSEPALVGPFEPAMKEIGSRMTIAARSLLGMKSPPVHIVSTGSRKTERTLDPRGLQPSQFYWFLEHEPADPEELRDLLARAREAGVEVLFFSPPRPLTSIRAIGSDGLEDLQQHVVKVADSFNVPLWLSPLPWPDDHFMDINAHTNSLGRTRFQKELTQWYRDWQ